MQADGVRGLWASLVRPDRRRRIDSLIDYFGGAPGGRVIRLRRDGASRGDRARRELAASAARWVEVRGGRIRRAGSRPAWI
jgi:hypothetical protein